MRKKVGIFASEPSGSSEKGEVPPPLCLNPRLVRTLLDGHEWEGTVTDLGASLGQLAGSAAFSAAHLAIWLRRHEPTLWWEHGVRIRFSRTGKCRTVHLSLRDSGPGNLAVTGVGADREIGDG